MEQGPGGFMRGVGGKFMVRSVLRFLFWPFRLMRRRPILSGAVLLFIATAVGLVGVHFWALREFHEAEVALDEDHPPEAFRHISFCLKVWPWSDDAHFLAAQIARLSGAYPEAEAQLAECRKLEHGSTGRTQLEILLLRAQRGDVEKVEGGLLYMADNDKTHEREILETLARGHMKLMRFLPALGLLDRCLEEYPDDVRALDWRGWILERLQRQEAAAKDYVRALRLSPGRTEVRIRLAALYLSHNDPEMAGPHLEILEKTHPDRLEVQLALAQARFLQGREEEARVLLDRVLAVDPKSTLALLYRGKLALQAEPPQLQEAEKYFRDVLQGDPNSLEALHNLHESLRAQPGREKEDAEVLRTEEEVQAKGARIQALLAGEAEQPSQKADAAYELGKMNEEMGQPDLAIYWLRTAEKRDAKHKPTHALLAKIFEKSGREDEAAQERRLAGP
jgi:Flp pilus assembly protein TadD